YSTCRPGRRRSRRATIRGDRLLRGRPGPKLAPRMAGDVPGASRVCEEELMGRRRGASATVGTVAGTAVDAAVAGEVGAVATKAAGRVTKRAGRAARKAGAAAEQAGENVRRGRGPLTPARARRMIGLSKVVLPLLA